MITLRNYIIQKCKRDYILRARDSMITLKDYLQAYKRYPFTTKKSYEGQEEDKKLIVSYNKALLSRYPWLLPRNRWTGNVVADYDYSHTELDWMPEGWRIAFGEQMCEEIQQALLHAQELNPEGGYDERWITTNYDSDKKLSYVEGFRILDLKEKYGVLRVYCGGAPQEVYDVVDKYEELSKEYCIRCGKHPTTWQTSWWISYYCDDCKNELEANEDFEDSFILIQEVENKSENPLIKKI